MDDLRIALLIAGVAVVVGVYAFARVARRNARKGEGNRNVVDAEPPIGGSAARETSPPLDPLSAGEDDLGGSTWMKVNDLAGIFAPRREMSDVELSVDVSLLADLRASYESTMDATVAPTLDAPPAGGEAATAAHDAPPPSKRAPAGVAAQSSPASAPDPGTEESLAIDMSLPLVYLTLLSKDKRLPGRAVIEALEDDGFRPGLMQLYYRRSDFDPAVVVGVANMVESGALDPESLPDIETPGLVSFIGVAKDPAQALKTFNTMVAASRRLAQRLQVTLCDETRSALTSDAESRMRARVGNIARRSRDEDRMVPESEDAALRPGST